MYAPVQERSMNRHTLSLRHGCRLAALLGGLILSGCQSLDFPWASSEGLPKQWEPDAKQVSAEQ
jgi:hypothetical protein